MSRIMRWVLADAIGFAFGRMLAWVIPRRPALVVDDPTPDEVGICGDTCDPVVGTQPIGLCVLAAGHRGWHRSDIGTWWPAARPPCERCEEFKAELREADRRWADAVNENARLRLRLAVERGDE